MDKCPWPEEPLFLQTNDLELVDSHCGPQTEKILGQAKSKGLLDPKKEGTFVEISVRCSYQEVGKFQHKRDSWHYDRADKGWIYILGTDPTQFRERDRVWDAELGVLTPYHGIEHRCPPQTKPGWRYFLRIMWTTMPSATIIRGTS